jgi:hypothetical protein
MVFSRVTLRVVIGNPPLLDFVQARKSDTQAEVQVFIYSSRNACDGVSAFDFGLLTCRYYFHRP